MKTRSAVVLVPTIGLPLVKLAVESVLSQTHALTKCMVIIDGQQYEERVHHIFSNIKDPRLNVITIPSNTGGKKYCGHRIYAALAHLVNEDYVLYLDEDNWLDATHRAGPRNSDRGISDSFAQPTTRKGHEEEQGNGKKETAESLADIQGTSRDRGAERRQDVGRVGAAV